MQIFQSACVFVFAWSSLFLAIACSDEIEKHDQEEVANLDHANVTFQISPNGKEIVFSCAKGKIYLFDMDTRRVNKIQGISGYSTSPAFSSDGKQIVYSSGDGPMSNTNIWIYNRNECTTTSITRNNKTCDLFPQFSNGDNSIIFARAHKKRRQVLGGTAWDEWELVEVNVNTQEERKLTGEAYYQISRPCVYKDDIFYTGIERTGGAITKLFHLNKSGAIVQLAPFGNASRNGIEDPSVSKAGDIVFTSDIKQSFWYEIYTFNHNNRSITSAKTGRRYNRHPTFHPIDQSIYFLSADLLNSANQPIFGLWQTSVSGPIKIVATHHLFSFPESWNDRL